jgi:CHASE2 domain-containing sensor protein
MLLGVLVLIVLSASYAPGLQGLETAGLDLAARLAPEATLEPRVALVTIDAEDIEAVGAWPWPRDRLARLVRRVSDAGARTIGVMVPLDQADTPARLPELLAEIDEGRDKISERLDEIKASKPSGTRARERRKQRIQDLEAGAQELDKLTYWLKRADTDAAPIKWCSPPRMRGSDFRPASSAPVPS